MATKEEAKAVILKLIEKYDKVVASSRLKKYTEEETKKDFILPLFRALGWSMEDSSEVSAEERISKGRVDYGFRINGIPKFFLEAKALKEDLLNEKFVKQAVNYSWHKGCTWAVLTDFEAVRIFNAEWKYSNPLQSHFMTIKHTDFIDRIDDLWLVSRESFERGLLDKKAEQYGKKSKKTSVDKQLLADFTRFRELLSKSVMKNNANRKLIEREEELDEAIQRFLDRLIFIRNCEDRELESQKLVPALREWISHKKGSLQKKINEIFTYFDDAYNSKIFAKHLCDQLIIEDNPLSEVILGLHKTKDKTIYYDFSAIEADTLGNIYEQYLGHILSKSEKRAKVKEAKGKRKAQGIYYTPTYIVDYIVRNTLGELLKKKKPKDLENIRVLDPACGSGSFLIKAFDVLNEHYAKDKSYSQTTLDTSGAGATYSRKLKILKNNIFGVDLDKQAVEIAQLNLLLKVAEKGRRLPVLQENIKNGNSLFSDEKYAGKKAFKWDSEFSKIMSENGFDVIIGNPPYVDIKGMPPEQVRGLFDQYVGASNRINLYSIFVERAIQLLKPGGFFGFIIPNSVLFNSSYKKIREILFKETNLTNIVRLPNDVFEDAIVETIILIFRKKKGKDRKTKIFLYSDKDKVQQISEKTARKNFETEQKLWEADDEKVINVFLRPETRSVLAKIESGMVPMVEVADFCLGLTPYDKYKGHTKEQIENKVFHSDHKKDETFKKLLAGGDVVKYGVLWNGESWIKYGPWLGAPREKKFFEPGHIIVRQIISGSPLRIFASIAKEELYNTQVGFNILSKDNKKYPNEYLLAMINSNLMNFYHREKYLDQTKNLFQKILIQNAKKFPIVNADESTKQKIISLVGKATDIRTKLLKLGNKLTDERTQLEKGFVQVDREIDDLVYKLYGITEKERKVIEDSLR